MLIRFLPKIIKFGLILTLFTPLVFWNGFIFPAITAKAFFVQTIVEILAFLYLVLVFLSPEYRVSLRAKRNNPKVSGEIASAAPRNDEKDRPRFSPLSLVLALFFVILIITGITGLNSYHSFWSSFERMWGIIFFLHLWAFFLMLTVFFRTEREWQKLFNFSVFIALAVAGLAILQHLRGLPAYSTIGNTAFLASYLLLNIFFALWLAVRTRIKTLRFIYGLALSIFVVAFLLAGSRGAFLGFAGGLGFLLFGLVWTSKKFRLPAAVFIVVIAAVMGILFLNRDNPGLSQNPYFGRLLRISLKEPTAQTRLLAWRFALEGFKERPVLGVGQENFNLVFNKHFDPEFYQYGGGDVWFDRAHNQLLDYLVNAGIFGFLSYLGIFGIAFYILFRSLRAERSNLVLAAGLFAYFSQNLFVFDTQSSILVFFLLLGYLGFVRPAGGGPDRGEKNRRGEYGRPVLAAAAIPAAVLLAAAVYYFNVRPALAAHHLSRANNLIAAEKAVEYDAAIADSFKKSLSYGTFGRTEARKLFAKFFVDRSLENRPFEKQFFGENLPLAAAEMEKNVEENPLNIYPLMQLADLQILDLAFLGDLKAGDAEKTAQRMIDLNPGRLEGYFLLAEIKYQDKRFSDAAEILEKAAAMCPSCAEAHYRLSVALEAAGRPEGSAAELERAYDLGYNVENIIDLLKLADLYIVKGDLSRAVSFYEKAVMLQSDNFQLWSNLADGYRKIGEYQKARDAANVVLQIAPPEYREQAEQFLKSIENK